MSIMECIFLLLFGLGFTIILYMETQINQIKAMMEEHIKYDQPLKNGNGKKH